ncbi:FUSC family protein [Paenibacillus turpanensis]|uniref:FUSC family protein n=1 Tax=Paenibacillus turpanensis TaxID=2689078 RepID=UPI00140C1753|nr:aromatic acid exporter family protein [Paenibacillus turpanensis]
MTLGARVIKTGLSITLALYLCSLLGLSPAIFAAVAAIFTIQPSIYRTWRQMLEQVQANSLGAFLALFGAKLIGNEPFAIGLVAIIVILICLRLKMESSIGLTLVTVLAIMEAPGQEWSYALNRFGIIMLGIGSAFLINIFVLPPKHEKQFEDKIGNVFKRLSLLLRTSISNEMKEKTFKQESRELQEDLQKLDELFRFFDEERKKLRKVKPLDTRRFVVYKQMLHTLHKGADVLEAVNEHFFQSRMSAEMNGLYDDMIEKLMKYHEYLLLAYEGKMKRTTGIAPDIAHLINDEAAHMDEEEHLRLLVVAASIYEYGHQLQRLDRLIHMYLHKDELQAATDKHEMELQQP